MGQSPMQQMQLPGRQDIDSPTGNDPAMEKRLHSLNLERQKQMVSDADKLLKLAKELNDEVAASGAGTLNSEQLHKVAEIEKLARSVKKRMVNGVAQPQPVLPPPGFPFPAQRD